MAPLDSIDPALLAAIKMGLSLGGVAAALSVVALVLRASTGGADPRTQCDDCGAPMHRHIQHVRYFKCANGHVWVESPGSLVRSLRRVPDPDHTSHSFAEETSP